MCIARGPHSAPGTLHFSLLFFFSSNLQPRDRESFNDREQKREREIVNRSMLREMLHHPFASLLSGFASQHSGDAASWATQGLGPQLAQPAQIFMLQLEAYAFSLSFTFPPNGNNRAYWVQGFAYRR